VRRGRATLFALTDPDKRAEMLGIVPIGENETVLPASNANSSWSRFENRNIRNKTLLVCVTFFNDNDTAFEQAFMFQRASCADPNAPQLLEMPVPDIKQCRQAG
jgi:hypothetical protein